jgi:hypothetical protein
MRILVDLGSHVAGDPQITQVEKVPPRGIDGATAINGKYVIPVPPGMDFRVDSSDYVLNGGIVDGGDVSSITYAHLLAAYPMFGHVYFNPLLTADHVSELDLAATFKDQSSTPPDPPTYYPTRAQTGRFGGLAGQMPTHTALLAQNGTLTPPRPGILISDLIDITTPTGGVGADEFMLYWTLYDFTVSDDVAADHGLLTGQNAPAIRQVIEADPEPSGFSAYISTDDGANWCEAGLLEPLPYTEKTTAFRVAFKNTTASKIYLASFGVLF